MFKAGINPKEISDAVKWLTGPNLQSQFPYVILCPNSLYAKWDRITTAMGRGKQAPAKATYVKGKMIYFPDEPRSAGGGIKHRVATEDEITNAKAHNAWQSE